MNSEGHYEKEIESPWIRLIVKADEEENHTAFMLTRKKGRVMRERACPSLFIAIEQCNVWHAGAQIGFTEKETNILMEEPI